MNKEEKSGRKGARIPCQGERKKKRERERSPSLMGKGGRDARDEREGGEGEEKE